MTDSSSTYLRYVVLEVTDALPVASVQWHERAATAVEGFQFLESRIAGHLVAGTSYPRLALVDCNEGRALGWSAPTPPGDTLVEKAVAYARSFPVAAPVPRPPGNRGDAPEGGDPSGEPEGEESPLDQASIDAFVDGFLMGQVDVALYQVVCDSLAAVEDCDLGEDFVCAVSHELLAKALALAGEAEIRNALDLKPSQRVTLDRWIEYTTDCLLPSLLDDGYMSRALSPVEVTGSRGRSVILVKGISGYSFTKLLIDWHGAWRSWEEFLDQMPRYWFTEADDFAAMSKSRQRKFIKSARG